MSDADDYGQALAMPLFDDSAPDPFAASSEQPTAEQRRVAEIIWSRGGGWKRAVSGNALVEMTSLAPREIKAIVEALRNTHKLGIGSRHEEPAGYYRIVTEEDRRMAVGPYRSQILKMWRTLQILGTRGEMQSLLDELREQL